MSGEPSFQIIPAVDLKAGRVVRLTQGREEAEKVYSTDPAAVAEEWVGQGARRLHVVNLDGAFGRRSRNLEVLRSICARCAEVNALIQYGGGLRTLGTMDEALQAGAGKIVVGTVAVENPDLLGRSLELFGAERLIVALDAVEGRAAIRGWKELSDRPVLDLAYRLREAGVREILYTDIKRDGMLSGPDLAALKSLAGSGMRVIASGGVASVKDVEAIRALGESNLIGVIIGKALYEGRLDLASLLSPRTDEVLARARMPKRQG